MVTPTREDYIRGIYHLQERVPGEVKLIHLAEHLSLSKSTVTERIAELVEEDFVTHPPYHGVDLTKKGRRFGRDLTYRHRVIETFLVNILGLKGKIVHEEAHKMEHACGDVTIDAMRRLIPDETHCPDGSLIPTKLRGAA